MNEIWSLTVDDYLVIIERAKAEGVKEGESMEKQFRQYMAEKNVQPIGHTELSKEEYISELISKDKKIIDISVDAQGKQSLRFIKKDNMEEK